MQDAGTCNTGLRWHFHVAASAANLQQNFFSRLKSHYGRTRGACLERPHLRSASPTTRRLQHQNGNFVIIRTRLMQGRSSLANVKIVARGITMN